MTLQQLRYLVAAADLGSFSGAAAQLHLAQPSVSEQVRALEGELGVALFVRAGRRLQPTEAGRTLLRHARRVLAAVEDAQRAVADVREVLTGTVTLGIFGTASYYLVADVIEQFRRRYPGVRVRLVGENSAQVADDVRSGRIEAGLVFLPIDDDGLTVRPIRQDQALYASTRLARVREPATIERLVEVPLVLAFATHGSRDPTRRQLAERAQRAGLVLAPTIEVEELDAALDIAARGLADTVVSATVAALPWFPKGLGTVPFADPLYETFAIVTRRETVPSPAVAALLRIAERTLAGGSREG
jgi:DNA-binding transcriptional LysR family regulator